MRSTTFSSYTFTTDHTYDAYQSAVAAFMAATAGFLYINVQKNSKVTFTADGPLFFFRNHMRSAQWHPCA